MKPTHSSRLPTTVLLLAAALAWPAAAQADRVSMFRQNGVLYFNFDGSTGEANQLTITSYGAGNDYCAGGPGTGFSHQACYFVTDPSAAGNVQAGGYCYPLDPTYPGEAECDYGGPTHSADDSAVHITLYLDDRNDTVTLSTAAAEATIYGGPGDDTIATLGAAEFKLYGGPGDDHLYAVNSGDILQGGTGNDTLVEPPYCGLATLSGGPGTDTVEAGRDCLTGVTLDLRPGHHAGGIENAVGSDGPDKLIGNGLANTLRGGAGNDRIFGLGGNDTLDGGAGNDLLQGGVGRDVFECGAGRDRTTDRTRHELEAGCER